MKYIYMITSLFILIIFNFGQNLSIKLEYDSYFSYNFQSGRVWQNVSESAVKAYILQRVTEDYQAFNIPVSTTQGNLVAKIGKYEQDTRYFGMAISGIGSYIDGNVYAEIYSNNFGFYSEFQGNNATVSRIGETIAGSVSHEIGHLLNLYHAYMFNSFDPTISGALNSNYQPKETYEGLPEQCKTDPNKHNHIMATQEYITFTQRATINRYFSQNSTAILNLVVNGGGTINRNITWGIPNRTFNQQNDIIVSPGKTMFIASGGYNHNINNKFFRSEGTGLIQKYGNIAGYTNYATGKAYFPNYISTIAQLLQYASSGWNINIVAGTYNENVTIPYGIGIIGNGVNNTTINGSVTFNNASYASLSNVKVNNVISVNNSNNVTLDNVKAGSTSSYIDAVGSSINLNSYYSDVTRLRALYIHNNSDYFSAAGTYRNKLDGIHIENNSNGQSFYDYFCQNQTYDIVSFNATVLANNCVYSRSQPGSSVFGDNITWYGWSSCGSGGFYKASNNVNIASFDTNEEDEAFKKLYAKYSDIRKIKVENIKTDTKRNESILEKEIKEYIESASEGNAIKAIGLLTVLKQNSGEYTELENYLEQLSSDKTKSKIRVYAQNSKITNYIKKGEYKSSIELSDRLIKENPDHILVKEWEYGQGLVYKYHLNDANKATEIFSQIKEKYKNHPIVESANKELGIETEEKKNEEIGKSEFANELEINNSPNPFNPSTRIEYKMPESGKVVIKVYNMLGQEIAELVNEEKEKGIYQVNFNAGNIASGVYIYRIEALGKVISRKMLLVK